MKRILLLSFAFLTVVAFSAMAQRTVSGKVTDDSGEALPGVNVVIKGTTTGTTTDLDGNYRLSVDDGATLVFSFVGFETQEVAVGSRSTIDLSLGGATELQEVVVTGVAQGTSTKKLGFAYGKVGEETIKEVPAVDPANALRGKVAGVQVIQPSGLPGTAPEIRLRGSSVVNAGVSGGGPLIIVDGIITSNSLADINMNDVESIEVIKGAAGAALYGSQAGNGVVQIRTKRGSGADGVTRVTVRSEYGVTDLQREFPLSNSHFYQLDSDGDFVLSNPADPTTRIQDADGIQDNAYPRLFNQQEELFTSQSFNNNVVQIASSNKNSDLYVSFDNLTNEAPIQGLPSYTRNTARINADHNINKFRVSTSMSYSRSNGPQATEQAQGGFIYGVLLVEPDLYLRTPADDGQSFSPTLRFNGNGVNPLYNASVQKWGMERDRFLGNLQTSYEITDFLKVEGQYSVDKLFRTITFFQPIDFLTPSNPDGTGGSLSESELESTGEVFTGSIYFNKEFGDIDLGATVRYQSEEYNTDFVSLGGSNFVIGGIPQFDALDQTTVQATSSNTTVISENVFLNTTLDYQDKLIFDGLIRRDGTSLFGADQRTQTFGRASLAYRLTEDVDLPGINELKIRGSYGISGDRPGFDWQYETYNLSGGTAQKNILGNRDLKPVKLKETEAGINVAFLERFNAEFTYSKTIGEDNIFLVPLSAVAGFSAQYQNAGTVETTNLEFALGAAVIDKPNFSWDVSLVGNTYSSTITELNVPEFNLGGTTTSGMFRISDGVDFGTMFGQSHATSLSQLTVDGNGDVTNVAGYVEGGTSNTQLADYVVNRHGYVVRADAEGTFGESATLLYDPETGQPLETAIGNAVPDFLLGFNSTIKYKNISFYFLLDAQIGGDVYNATKQLLYFNDRHADLDQAGVAPEEQTAFGFWGSALSLYNGNNPTKHFVEDASYLKLREVNISYNLSRNLFESIGIGDVIYDGKISLIGRNLFTMTNYTGFDPEVSAGRNPTNFRVDSFTVPIYRTYSVSLQLRF